MLTRNFYADSLVECDRRQINDESYRQRVEHWLRFRQFQELCEPVNKMRISLYNLKVPRITFYPDTGKLQTDYEWTDAEREALDTCDKIIAMFAAECGLEQSGKSGELP